MKNQKENLLDLRNTRIIHYVYQTQRAQTSYHISDNPYLFSNLVFQGTYQECENYIKNQNEEHNSGQQQMGTI